MPPTELRAAVGRYAFFGARREGAGIRRQRLDPERPTDKPGTFASTKSVPILPKAGGFTDLVPKPTQIWFRFPDGTVALGFTPIRRTIYIYVTVFFSYTPSPPKCYLNGQNDRRDNDRNCEIRVQRIE